MSYENPSTQPDRDLDQDLPTRRELDLEDEIDALESYAGKLEREVTELEIALDSSQSYVSWLESQLIPMSLKLIEIYERERERQGLSQGLMGDAQ